MNNFDLNTNKFFYFSMYGDSMGLALQGQEAGDDILFYINDTKSKEVGDGLIKKANDWHNIDPERIVIFDMVKRGYCADQLRKKGHTVWGSSMIGDKIEEDRKYGMEVFSACGIRIPETHWFTNIDTGIKWLGKNKGNWYFKPSGNISTSTTFGSDSQDLAGQLEFYKNTIGDQIKEFCLQKKEVGVEVSIEGFWTGSEYLLLNSTFEDKQFLTGGRGQNTGCMMSCNFAYKSPAPKLYKLTLEKLIPYLEGVNYPPGPIDVNVMVSEKDHLPYALEFTTRLGYSAVYSFLELLDVTFDEMVVAMLSGEDIRIDKESYAGALRMSLPPYPISEDRKAGHLHGLPLPSLGKMWDNPHVWPIDVMKNKKGQICCAGTDAVICEITDKDKNLFTLRDKLYEKADELGKKYQCRDDFGETIKEDLQLFRQWGYLG